MSDLLTLQFSTSAPPKHVWEVDWSELIRRGCHSPFSHVDMVMPDGNLLGASNNPKAPIVITDPEGNANGVALRPPNYQEFAYRRNMVLRTPRVRDIQAIWRTQLGKSFDVSYIQAMISEKFPGVRDWRLNDCWACAEGIIWSLEVGEFWSERLPWPKNRVSPTDILMIMLMDPRWVNRDTFWAPISGLKLGLHER